MGSPFVIPRLFRSLRRRARMRSYLLIFGIVLLLIAPFYFIYKPPGVLFRYLSYRFPDVLFSVPLDRNEKVVALTIDDAPSRYTPGLLKLLSTHDARATFFVIGNQVHGNEGVLEDIVRQGSELANHAMSDQPSTSLSQSTLMAEIGAVHKLLDRIYEKLGMVRKERYFRPGSGFFSRDMLKTVKESGYALVLGTIYPHDAQISWSSVNVRHVMSKVRPGGIIILHDRRSWSIDTVGGILKGLKKRGYRVVTVTELLALSTHA